MEIMLKIFLKMKIEISEMAYKFLNGYNENEVIN